MKLGRLVTITRRVSFCASLRCCRPDWSDERNREVFGPRSNPHGYGHNYVLEVSLEGPIDDETGMVLNLRDIDQVIRQRVFDVYDHRHVNQEVPGFARRIPTLENLAIDIWERLRSAFGGGGARLSRVRLYETPELYVEYHGEGEEAGVSGRSGVAATGKLETHS